jgi:phage baseplate assembly protein V
MSYDLSEAYRKLAAMIRFGTITGVDLTDATAPRVTCTCGGLDTDWLPWHALRAGKTVHWSAPTAGEQVIVFAPGGETSLGFVLGGFYSSDNPAPSTDPNVDMTQYPDGSTVEYDSSSNTLTVSVSGNGNVVVNCKQATVNASTSVTLQTPNTHMTGNCQVDGNLGVTGVMSVQGTGAGGGAVSTFAGTIHVTSGDVTADSISLKNHTHSDPQGGNVGPATG